jgi:hypothetical protein
MSEKLTQVGLVNCGLTEFMPEIFRVDDGRRQWIKRVDVLTNHVSKSRLR